MGLYSALLHSHAKMGLLQKQGAMKRLASFLRTVKGKGTCIPILVLYNFIEVQHYCTSTLVTQNRGILLVQYCSLNASALCAVCASLRFCIVRFMLLLYACLSGCLRQKGLESLGWAPRDGGARALACSSTLLYSMRYASPLCFLFLFSACLGG